MLPMFNIVCYTFVENVASGVWIYLSFVSLSPSALPIGWNFSFIKYSPNCRFIKSFPNCSFMKSSPTCSFIQSNPPQIVVSSNPPQIVISSNLPKKAKFWAHLDICSGSGGISSSSVLCTVSEGEYWSYNIHCIGNFLFLKLSFLLIFVFCETCPFF